MKKRSTRAVGWLMVGALALAVTACGDDEKETTDTGGETKSGYACDYPIDELYKAASSGLEAKNPTAFEFLSNLQLTTDQQNEVAALIDGDAGMEPEAAAAQWVSENADVVEGWAPTNADGGEGITLAVNPWTGSMVNAQVAKAVLEADYNTEVTISEVDENVTWEGLDDGSIDATLEVWPSGHVEDRATYIDEKKTVVDIGPLGPSAKIGWYITKKVADEHPELLTWEGFKDEELAALFKTAESGDVGQFLMGDPSYVSYDEQIIENLDLPLKFVVAGTETALIAAVQDADEQGTPLLLQFWQPHWLHSQIELVEVELPAITPECEAAAA